MENNHIDQQFNEASRLSEEPTVFPGFEKVWEKVEEKLDTPKEKKKIIPLWFPYGIAASLIIGLGAFYFMNKKDTAELVKPVIAESKTAPAPVFNTDIATIDQITKENIQKEKKNAKPVIEKLAVNSISVPVSRPAPVVSPLDAVSSSRGDMPPPPIERHMETSGGMVKNIEEVVVMGYKATVKREKSITSSSTVVASTETTIAKELSGKVAGLSVSGSGKEMKMMIRGMSSVAGSSAKPLVIVNGKPANMEIIKILDPERIKKMSVMKGAEAAAIFGSKASNGVIIIKTKRLRRAEREKFNELLAKGTDEPVKEPVEEPEEQLPKAGQLTGGEVNDFFKWDYWKDVAVPELDRYKNTWKFFPDRRVSVQLVNKDKKPVVGEKVKLLDDKKNVIWEAVSDNLGNAELWISPMINESSDSGKYYLADVSGQMISSNIREFKNGQNVIVLNKTCLEKRKLDLAFVVDATGSMGDEISYLQSELLDVLKKVETKLSNTEVRYGSVFYRDNGDEYVTRKFDFSDRAEDLIGFIKKQNASGGGDTPEAVVEAMQVSIDELKWSHENSTKIMFLILDAPPHQSEENTKKLYDKIKSAAEKGITIIPLAASDTGKETEYLMRTFALLTNGTYTFLTNDSGIGNDHIKPTAASYEVEKLNDLLLRLILQRATLPECSKGISNQNLNKKMETEIDNQPDTRTVVFPNPTKGPVQIKTKKAVDELFVYDIAGKIIMRKEHLGEGKNTIDMTSYPQGIYLLRIGSGEVWETFKVIRN
ncbi:T9SS type A sorting domain-containing protein [Chryseobacterium arthrosphaerae]|uniref:T9SS type A sorting domain-containing protein n=1 Tax=Chryseobacterium arthrosphaerae TaxID=651561 RepID=UPI001BB08CE7|nr:T9SS type A sorting domain-containing protein [Chryseobacterium arthrosphaerae]QUY53776.1 T9SS type A sorting domain-containing protein [Chryseobacterium arthrosphaerae]